MNSNDLGRAASPGGAPAGMPARLWEVAKHGDRGTIPQWVRAAPDAGATAPPRISQVARRAAQVAAAAGAVGAGIGLGIGATESASRPADLVHRADSAPATEHTSTDPSAGWHATTDSFTTPVPSGSASESQVTLHTSSDGGHLATGLATTWRIPGHGAAGGEHASAGVAEAHDGLTVEMYQDVVVSPGADGTFSVDAVEYVVVRDEHGHAYVFRDSYHTVVPDPPGQDADLVVHETDRVQIVEHPDGSFSVTQADNSISVTAGSSTNGQQEVTVTQTETVQLGHEPHADGHDTISLTEDEAGSTTSDQAEVATEQTVTPGSGEMSWPGDSATVPGTAATAAPSAATTAPSTATTTAPSVASTAAPSMAVTAASVQAGTALPAPDTFGTAPVMPALPPLAPSLGAAATATVSLTPGAAATAHGLTPGAAATTASGLTPGYEPHPPAAFAGLRGGPAEPGHGATSPGNFPNELAPAPHPASGVFGTSSGSVSGPFEHPATEPPASAPGPDPEHGVALAGHDQPGLDESSAQAGLGQATAEPAEPDLSSDAHSVAGGEEASGAYSDSLAGSVHALPEHDPGTDTAVIH